MSVPNVAHLDPQRGGCCTVMPYMNGRILELPVTTTQDYSLFHILNDYTIQLWTQQMEVIQEHNGLISFIVHPDYVRKARATRAYEALLSKLTDLRSRNGLWIAKPAEVDKWWRERMQMRLVPDGQQFRIEGHGSDRARIAFAYENNGALAFSLEPRTSNIPEYVGPGL
jgi:hypothetical protein